MELMTKYQYTYFIYPYIVDSKKYSNYILKLLKNDKCKLRIFEKEKDMHLYNYFLPSIRDYMFWSFKLSKNSIKDLKSLDSNLQATLLAENNCNIFQYELPKDLQGKIGEKNGIFFEISEIKIICYKTGINFIVFKTGLPDDSSFSDVLNFNYKFREVNSKTYNLKEYENIKIQSDKFKDVQEITQLIEEITGENSVLNKINIDNERFIIFSYACLQQDCWNEEITNENIENVFEKYRAILPANKQIADRKQNDLKELYENKYVRYGFSNIGTVLLTSDINTANYTTIAQKYESEYLYTYILELYKKFLLKKLNYDFNKNRNFKLVEKQFLDFIKKIWIEEITNDEFGKLLDKNWILFLEIEETFLKLKNKYDIIYKKHNVESCNKNNKIVLTVIFTTIIINIINILYWFMR